MPTMTSAITWFEIATSEPATAERFYGSLFGWSFQPDQDTNGYRMITVPGQDGPQGGLLPTGGTMPGHAIFYVQVEDVAATAAAAEAAGGKVLVPATATPDGLVFAHLLDPSGNHFGIWTPPAGKPA